ncbi:MAG: 50S ribosomal protein L17 [Deltaproteobacteria bacterium GWA2_55_10]|nr:MAG: 50S ribosomal protein L17 [Deltaproteobacteria bacterium GWA2_55_10]
MRHNRDEKRFDRTYSHLKSMLANMTNDLVMHGRIKTTTPKAKVLRSYAEKMITLGKNGSLAARRRAFAFMRNKTAVHKLFTDVAPLFKERNGGYTRILKLGNRPGDNASMSIIELVEGAAAAVAVEPAKPARKPAARKAKAPAKAKEEAPEKKEKAPARKAAPKKAAPKESAEKGEAKAPAKRAPKKAASKEE